ncbi:MAG: LegC family aminotransferase [Gammaproteobacteria bacterium]|nr:LegC family aminotransferase [Gammaproteobacteria bacterium]
MKTTVEQTFLTSLTQALAHVEKPIALHEPEFSGAEWEYVKECLDTGWVSSVGKFVDEFELKLAEFTGANYAIATSNGTSALHINFLLADVKANDEVLLPALTFIATANAISYTGALPHFVDINAESLAVDANKLADYLREIAELKSGQCFNKITGRRIKALCVVHLLGMPADLAALAEICQRYNLALIEDGAEALGTYYQAQHVGHHGLCGALSFNGNKVITTGGGGAILTDDKALALRAKHLTTTAKANHQWEFKHDALGYNYRLPNINAALGCAQLEMLPKRLAEKKELAAHYQAFFSDHKEVDYLQVPAYGQSNYWLNAVVLKTADLKQRDLLLTQTNQAGLMTRPLWNLIHTLPMYQAAPKMDLTVAENYVKRVICLPSSAKLGRSL